MMGSLSRKYLVLILLSLSLALVFGCPQSLKFPEKLASTMTATISPSATSNFSDAPRLAMPLECTLGKDCWIMHYVDLAPGPEVVDFGCGRQTYNGHDGTDFAIAALQARERGVSVVASAAGTVLRVRDGVADRLVADQSDREAVTGKECGNGAIVAHGSGWETQYCHLRQDSLSVKPGTVVEKGTVLGMVGASGLASFPHVHLTLRYNGQIVDPFVGVNPKPGCQVTRHPLWEQTLDYVSTGLIRAGFAPQPPEQAELWQGQFSGTQLAHNLPALVFWVQAFGVLQGDVEHFKLSAPNGQAIIDRENTLKAPSRSWVSYVGKRHNPQKPLFSGVWRGQYQLRRENRLIFAVEREVTIK